MKVIINFAIAFFLLTTISVNAQNKKGEKIKSATMEKDSVAGSEVKKNQYKSKQWRQGNITPEETKAEEKIKPGTGTKPVKSRKTPPPPVPLQPPTGLPPTK